MSNRLINPLISALIVTPALLVVPAGRAWTVDLSCIGVQTQSAAGRINALGSGGTAYKPVLDQVRQMQREATERIAPLEKAWDDSLKQFRQAHPNVSDADVMREIRKSAEMDAHLARLARAQYEAHITEANQIIKAREIPLPDNQRRVDALAGQFVATRGLSTHVYNAVQESQSFRHLVSTLAAAETARDAPQAIPGAPLARVGFDTKPESVRVEAAARAAATLIIETDANRQKAQLALGHLRDFTGNREVRAATMRDTTKPATREFTAQAGTALNEFVKSREVFERFQHIEIPEKVEKKKLPEAVAEKVEEAVQIIYVYVGGSKPPEQQSPSQQTK